MSNQKTIKRVRAYWTEVILVCSKCSKKLGGGFGEKGDERLAKSLRKKLGSKTKNRKTTIAIIEIGCLDICPKNAVVVVRAATPGDWAVIPKGLALDSIIERFDLGHLTGEENPLNN